MGSLKNIFIITMILAGIIQEAAGFVRVGRTEERKRDKFQMDEIEQKEEIGNGEMLEKKIIKQLALAKFLIDAYNNWDKEAYLIIAKRSKRGFRKFKDIIANRIRE